jgi:hypothetical protein
MFDFTVENSTNEGDFPKLSTGEFPVFSGPVDLLNRSGRTGSSAGHNWRKSIVLSPTHSSEFRQLVKFR